MHKIYTMALKTWYLDSEKLLSIISVPDSDLVYCCGCEDLGEIVWECDIVYTLVVACVTELGV